MKTRLLLLAGLLLGTFKISAADLCVEENGNFGCYSTISAAISAATNGDRIIINPRAGNTAYLENISITKTLQFLCAADTEKYFIQGNITITPANGRTVTFIGMKLLGDLTTTTNNAAGLRCNVNVLGSDITGNVNFDYDNFNVNFSSNLLNGYFAFKYGKMIGNLVTSTNGYYVAGGYRIVYIGTDVTATNDTIYVVGNKINNVNPGYFMPIIAANTSSQFVYISNNLINVSGSYTSYNYGIYFLNYKNSTVSRNFVLNNTINSTGNMQYGLLFDPAPTNGYTEVYNNLIIAPTGNFPGIGGAIGPVAASFNYMNAPLSLSNTFDNGTNNTSSNTTLDINGRQIAGSDVINGASPDFAYYDLDLSVGDAGAFGGSFTLDNFFPITGSTRVYMVYAPRRVNVSGTINIKADGFDR